MRLLVGLLILTAIGFSQTVTPFTSTRMSRHFDPSGKLISESRFLVAKDRNGSMVSMDLDPNDGQVRQIINVAADRMVLIDPKARSASEMPYHWNSSQACEDRFWGIVGADIRVDRSPRTFEGIAVERVSVKFPNGGLAEVLLAPSLGCEMLQSATWENGRLIQQETSKNLKLGSPDHALFAVPAGYKLTRTYPR